MLWGFLIYSKNALNGLKWCLIIKHYDFLKSVPFIVVSFSFVENPLIVLFSPFLYRIGEKQRCFFHKLYKEKTLPKRVFRWIRGGFGLLKSLLFSKSLSSCMRR